PSARSRSRASASCNAFGLTVIAACSLSSKVAIRTRYCRTISCEVTRPCSSAARISGIVASTTVNDFPVCAEMVSVTAAPTAAIAIKKRCIGDMIMTARGKTKRIIKVSGGSTMFRYVVVVFALTAATAAAQDHDHGAAAGEKLGTVHFTTSCTAAAQPAF